MSDLTRAVAIRRGMRNLDAWPGHTPEHDNAVELELGRAYDAGHIAGSGVKHQTDAEHHLCEVIRELSDTQVVALGMHGSLELLDAIEAIRASGDAPEPEIGAENFDVGHL